MRDKETYNEKRKREREENKRLVAQDEDGKIGLRYTEEEDDFIIENLYLMSAKEIGYALGKTQISIYGRVQWLRKKGLLQFYKTEKMEKYANSLKKVK